VIRLLDDRILVKFNPLEEKSRLMQNGLFAPEGAVDDVHQWGTVLATGPGKLIVKGPHAGTYRPIGVKPGDHVLYIRFLKHTHTGQSLRFAEVLEDDQFIIREDDVLACEDGQDEHQG